MEENKSQETTEVLTEVTTIAKEEAKTGQPAIPKLSEEELVSRHSAAFISAKRQYHEIFRNLSSKAKTRVALAVLDLPTNGINVTLKEDDERYAFMIGQQALASRFVITQHYINQEIKGQREAALKAELDKQKLTKDFAATLQTETKPEGDTNEQQ